MYKDLKDNDWFYYKNNPDEYFQIYNITEKGWIEFYYQNGDRGKVAYTEIKKVTDEILLEKLNALPKNLSHLFSDEENFEQYHS